MDEEACKFQKQLVHRPQPGRKWEEAYISDEVAVEEAAGIEEQQPIPRVRL
jgi:hypothetical protein